MKNNYLYSFSKFKNIDCILQVYHCLMQQNNLFLIVFSIYELENANYFKIFEIEPNNF